MAYDEELDRRVSSVVGDDLTITTKKMFGGVCYLCNGNMALGITGDDLMVRVGPERWEALLAEPNVREMDFTGRSMRGFVFVAADGLERDEDLERWVNIGVDFADSLPPKPPKDKAHKQKPTNA